MWNSRQCAFALPASNSLPDVIQGIVKVGGGYGDVIATLRIAKAKGFRGYKINKGIESPERYLLMIFWETLENHTVDFRGSPAFQDWRALVGPFFAAPPAVEHFNLLSKSD